MSYLTWDEKTITDFSEKNINTQYDSGFLFTREDKGKMYQTRSLRIDLSQFELSSENRRILRKTEDISLTAVPLPHTNYHWKIGKMAKDFYQEKFGDGTFSANKIKELMTDANKGNFNKIFVYGGTHLEKYQVDHKEFQLGYCIALENTELIHYCYPFYDMDCSPKNMGMGMMTGAVIYAKEKGKKYIYLGSLRRPTDTYKLQFTGSEWFDGKKWTQDKERLSFAS